MVFRTFPIRVAGEQAGILKDEISWEELRSESGYPYDIKERTSVTNKVRRVGRFDWHLATRAAIVNRPSRLAVNGLDYLNFKNKGVTDPEWLSKEATDLISEMESNLQTPFTISSRPRLNNAGRQS